MNSYLLALHDINTERRKQIKKKGYDDNHDNQHTWRSWLAILAHEVGCLGDVLLNNHGRTAYRNALAKVGAGALAALEALHRADD